MFEHHQKLISIKNELNTLYCHKNLQKPAENHQRILVRQLVQHLSNLKIDTSFVLIDAEIV